MRVAVQHTDSEHPNAGTFAYKFGRVQDFTHPITGETTKADDIMLALLDQARAEYSEADGYKVWPERLEDDGAEDCYLCSPGNGEEPTGALHKVDEEGNLVVTDQPCPNCNGQKQTPKGTWKEIDEGALRERASGEPVEVPLTEQLDVPSVPVAAEQPVETTTTEG